MSTTERIVNDLIELAYEGETYEVTTGMLATSMMAAVLHLRDEIPDDGETPMRAQEHAAQLVNLTRAKCFQFAQMASEKALPKPEDAETRKVLMGSLANAIMALLELQVTAEACGVSHVTARGFTAMAAAVMAEDTFAVIGVKGGAA